MVHDINLIHLFTNFDGIGHTAFKCIIGIHQQDAVAGSDLGKISERRKFIVKILLIQKSDIFFSKSEILKRVQQIFESGKDYISPASKGNFLKK